MVQRETNWGNHLNSLNIPLFFMNEKEINMEKILTRYQDILEKQMEMICRWLPDTKLTYVNRAFCDFFGKRKDELLGEKWIKLVPKNIQKEICEKNKKLWNNSRSCSFRHPIINKQGEKRWILWTETPIFDKNNNLVEFQSQGHDITDYKITYDKLLKSEKRHRNLLKTLHEGIWIIDENFITIYVNEPMAKMLGYTREEMYGKKPFDFMDEKNKKEAKLQLELRKHGSSRKVEREFLSKEGYIVTVLFATGPMFDENGNYVGAIAGALDITKQKHTEKKLYQYTKKLESRNKEIKRLYDKINEEIKKAEEIHMGTLPSKFPKIPNVSIAAHYKPASNLGGDIYDVVKQDNKLIFYLSDVTGHGLEGALMNAFIKESIESYITLKPEEICPEKIMWHLNRQYKKNGHPDDYFVSIFLGILDLNTYVLNYTGAGFQEHVLVFEKNRGLLEINSKGPPISNTISTNLMDFYSKKLELTPSFTIFAYTDGLAEQEVEGKLFKSKIKTVFKKNKNASPLSIKKEINKEFANFNKQSLRGDDDITYLIIKVES